MSKRDLAMAWQWIEYAHKLIRQERCYCDEASRIETEELWRRRGEAQRLTKERDEARAEVERLKAEMQTMFDLASARLRDATVTETNTRHDLGEIARIAARVGKP